MTTPPTTLQQASTSVEDDNASKKVAQASGTGLTTSFSGSARPDGGNESDKPTSVFASKHLDKAYSDEEYSDEKKDGPPGKKFNELNLFNQLIAYFTMNAIEESDKQDQSEDADGPVSDEELAVRAQRDRENAELLGYGDDINAYHQMLSEERQKNWKWQDLLTFTDASLSRQQDAMKDRISKNPEPVTGGTYQKFLDLLRDREGSNNTVYLDSRGFPTVGIGHLVKPEDHLKVGDRITDAQANAFLQQEGQQCFRTAQKQAAEIGVTDANFIVALSSVNYQLGTGWRSKFSQTWDKIAHGDIAGAKEAVANSAWARQTPTRVKDFENALAALDMTGGVGHSSLAPVLALNEGRRTIAPAA